MLSVRTDDDPSFYLVGLAHLVSRPNIVLLNKNATVGGIGPREHVRGRYLHKLDGGLEYGQRRWIGDTIHQGMLKLGRRK